MILAILALAAAPHAATSNEVQGHAVVECRVTAAGWLRDCRVLSESPANANVGVFALKLAKGFHVQPDDRRVRAGRIRIPLQFKMPAAR